MPLSLKEVMQREEALRREIAEREHLLAAYERIRMDLLAPRDGSDPSAPPAEAPPSQAHGPTGAASADSQVAHIDPQLTQMQGVWGGSRRLVTWAIERVQGDFDLHTIARLLEGEGCKLKTAEISVVLSRMNTRGEIEQISPGHGRTGSLYRKPGGVTVAEAASA